MDMKSIAVCDACYADEIQVIEFPTNVTGIMKRKECNLNQTSDNDSMCDIEIYEVLSDIKSEGGVAFSIKNEFDKSAKPGICKGLVKTENEVFMQGGSSRETYNTEATFGLLGKNLQSEEYTIMNIARNPAALEGVREADIADGSTIIINAPLSIENIKECQLLYGVTDEQIAGIYSPVKNIIDLSSDDIDNEIYVCPAPEVSQDESSHEEVNGDEIVGTYQITAGSYDEVYIAEEESEDNDEGHGSAEPGNGEVQQEDVMQDCNGQPEVYVNLGSTWEGDVQLGPDVYVSDENMIQDDLSDGINALEYLKICEGSVNDENIPPSRIKTPKTEKKRVAEDLRARWERSIPGPSGLQRIAAAEASKRRRGVRGGDGPEFIAKKRKTEKNDNFERPERPEKHGRSEKAEKPEIPEKSRKIDLNYYWESKPTTSRTGTSGTTNGTSSRYGGSTSGGYGGTTSKSNGSGTSSGYGASTSKSYGGTSSSCQGSGTSSSYGGSISRTYGSSSSSSQGGGTSSGYGASTSKSYGAGGSSGQGSGTSNGYGASTSKSYGAGSGSGTSSSHGGSTKRTYGSSSSSHGGSTSRTYGSSSSSSSGGQSSGTSSGHGGSTSRTYGSSSSSGGQGSGTSRSSGSSGQGSGTSSSNGGSISRSCGNNSSSGQGSGTSSGTIVGSSSGASTSGIKDYRRPGKRSSTQALEESIEKVSPEEISLPFLESLRGSIKKLTREDLEELIVQKLCEVITERSTVGQLRKRAELVERDQDRWKERVHILTKQMKEMDMVMKRYLSEVRRQTKNKNFPMVSPLRVTRSVGLQVSFTSSSFRQTRVVPHAQPSTSGCASPVVEKVIKPVQQARCISPNSGPPSRPKMPAQTSKEALIIDLTEEDDEDSPVEEIPPKPVFQHPTVAVRPPSQIRVVNHLQPQPQVNTANRVAYLLPATTTTTSGSAGPSQTRQVLIATPTVQQTPRNVLPSVPPLLYKGSTVIQPGTQHPAFISQGGRAFIARPLKHPAPLPTPPSAQGPKTHMKQAPPKPTLKISKVPSGIVLSWNMSLGPEHEEIEGYQLYAYQESATPPSTSLWKRVGDVKALPLPMACTLTQFVGGHKYYFAVRAVDIHSRVGPFSNPGSIVLVK